MSDAISRYIASDVFDGLNLLNVLCDFCIYISRALILRLSLTGELLVSLLAALALLTLALELVLALAALSSLTLILVLTLAFCLAFSVIALLIVSALSGTIAPSSAVIIAVIVILTCILLRRIRSLALVLAFVVAIIRLLNVRARIVL